MKEQELHNLLKKFAEGDQEAFESIYKQINHQVYRTVYFLMSNKHDVNDVVSEVYIQLFKSLHLYDRNQPFHAWLNGVAIRQVQNWNRKIWRKFRLFDRVKSLNVEPVAKLTDEPVMEKERNAELLNLVEHLSFKLKLVIVLRYYHDYTYEEIASVLNIPTGTVKSRHHQAIQKLRDLAGYSKGEKEEPLNVS